MTILFNRNLVVDAAKVDSLPVPDDSRHDVDDDRRHVGGEEVVDGVQGRLERRPVEVAAVERPLIEHEQQEQRRDDRDHGDRRHAGDLVTRNG